MKKINILNINLIAGRTGAAKLSKNIVDSLPQDIFSCHTLVGYDFGQDANATSVYHTSQSRFYLTCRYKLAVGLNFLFDLMTPGCIDMAYLKNSSEYQQADIVHLHSIQGGYFDRHMLDMIAKEKKIIMTLHDDWLISGNDYNNNLFSYKRKYQYDIRKKILQNVVIHYVGVSHWITNKIKADPIVGHNTPQTIYNGINTSVFKKMSKCEARKKLGLPGDKVISMSIAGSGSKSNGKGLKYVKNIARQHEKDDSMFFITIGNHKKNTNNNVLELPLISSSDMALYFNAVDVFLYPSLADSFGLVVAESLACGCPVVTFDVGGIPEIVQHKIDGYVAKYKDYDDLLKGFEWVMQHKDSLDITLNQKFTQESMVAQYIDLYKSLI